MVTLRNNAASLVLATVSMAMMGLTPSAQGHVMLATNPFFSRPDRALNRLASLMDDLVGVGGVLPPQVQPLWRRVVQHQTDMSQPSAADTSSLAFRAEAIEMKNNYVITCDLPGVKREDIRIAFLQDNVLSISAERKSPYEVAAAASPESAQKEGPNKDEKKEEMARSNVDIDNKAGSTISATTAASGETWPNYLMREIAYGKSLRSFKLPSDADTETTSAIFENGVLVVTLSKRQVPKEKLIEIK